MNKTLTTTLTVIAILAMAGIVFFAGSMYARVNTFGPSMMFGWGNDNTYGPNMMNGRGPSMMGGNGNMMQGYGYGNSNVTPLTIDQTKAAAEKYLTNMNISDLEIAEIMVFEDNGYVIVKEVSTGIGAFELLVDPMSQVAYPEHGPNMMWNLKYSGLNHRNMMGGNRYGMTPALAPGASVGSYGTMMQGWSNTTPLDAAAEMIVTPEQAIKYAQGYLDANLAGATTGHPMQFYGYYTFDFEKDGKVAGMLSINGYTGQVFLHTWHGTFIEEIEYE